MWVEFDAVWPDCHPPPGDPQRRSIRRVKHRYGVSYSYRQGSVGIEIDYLADHVVRFRSVTKPGGRILIRQPDFPIPRIVTGQFDFSVELSAFSRDWVSSPEG